MRKISIGLILCFGLCAMVYAGKVDDKSVNGGVYTLTETAGSMTLATDVISATTISATTVAPTTLTATAGTVAGKTPVVSTSASAITMLESGTKAATGATVTNAFAANFGSAPVVIYRYTGVDMPATNPVTITVSNFIVTAAQTNFQWIAIGAK